MLSAIIENTLTKENEYLYLKRNNNNLIYYGFSIQNSNIKPIDKEIITKIYNLFRVNPNCIYIGDYSDYKIYLDKNNNIKHYLKNGVEDFVMLFKNNGEDLNLYEKLKFEKVKSNNKKFKIDNFLLKISDNILDILLFLSISSAAFSIGANIGNFISESNIKNIVEPATESNIKNIVEPATESIVYIDSEVQKAEEFELNIIYSPSENEDLDLEAIDCNRAIELIKSSSLPPEIKDIAANESLFNDLFGYYKGTDMEYVIKDRLNGVSIKFYSEEDYPGALGYYSSLTPNVVNILETADLKSVFEHEFTHLLQSCNCHYMYLIEATAGIVSTEYFGNEQIEYLGAVPNTYLLMDVIGPKAIWETVFGGNDTNLVNIIKNNLSDSEADELITYLKQTPGKVFDESKNDRVTELISNLYRNINLSDIKSDRNIYDSNGNHINKIYFNEDIMNQKTISAYSIDEAINLGLITQCYEKLYLKEMPSEKYEQLLNNPEYSKLYYFSVIYNGKVNINNYNKIIAEECIPLRDDVQLHLDNCSYSHVSYNYRPASDPFSPNSLTFDTATIPEALSMGLIAVKYYEVVKENEITFEEQQNIRDFIANYSEYKINSDNVSIITDENGNPVNVQVTYGVESIKGIFPDQTVRAGISNNVIR